MFIPNLPWVPSVKDIDFIWFHTIFVYESIDNWYLNIFNSICLIIIVVDKLFFAFATMGKIDSSLFPQFCGIPKLMTAPHRLYEGAASSRWPHDAFLPVGASGCWLYQQYDTWYENIDPCLVHKKWGWFVKGCTTWLYFLQKTSKWMARSFALDEVSDVVADMVGKAFWL